MTTAATTPAATGATSAAPATQTQTATQTPAATAAPAAPAAPAAGAAVAAASEDAGILGASEAEKPAAESAAAIEVKLPEGFKADEELMKGFGAWAKEAGLDSAKAQKMVDLYAKRSGERAKADAEAFQKQQVSWRDSVKSDKEIGGQNYDQSLVDVKRVFGALDKDGSIRKEIAALGLGNHPALVRLAVRAAKLMKEDGVGAGNAPGSGERSEQEMLAIRYPSMFPKQ